jgi:hypothetical protein
MGDRKLRAMFLASLEYGRRVETTMSSRASDDWRTLRPIEILDDYTVIKAFIGMTRDSGYDGYVISCVNRWMTFHVACSWDIKGLVRCMMNVPDGDPDFFRHAKHLFYAEGVLVSILDNSTILAFCLYCIWFNITGRPMSRFPKSVNVSDIRLHGKFPEDVAELVNGSQRIIFETHNAHFPFDATPSWDESNVDSDVDSAVTRSSGDDA